MSKNISKTTVALVDRKKNIQAAIKYYEKRNEEAREDAKKPTYYFGNYDEDSDSDTDQIYLSGKRPSISELKQQEEMLQTCLEATQELSDLEVLQYEVKVLVKDPPLNGASPVQGEGVWREVVAECRLDLVPFAINFHEFKANRHFAPIEYRGLKVTLLKEMHQMELSKSILCEVTRPGHAIEVIRGYAVAIRARRTTLMRLSKHFGDLILMESNPEGGYRLKCANLLDMTWTLQNEWSPVAAFHHRTNFDFEYMEEAYVKIIKQLHRRLSDPDLDIEERTLCMTKIISTCLEAGGLTQEVHDIASLDPKIVRESHKRRRNPDREAEAPSEQRAHTGSAVMAPPTGLPKHAKKSRNDKTTKRPMKKEHNEKVDNPKRAKTVENTIETKANDREENTKNNVATSKINEQSEKTSTVSTSGGIKKKTDELVENEKITTKKVAVSTSGGIKKKSDEKVENEKITTKKVAVSTSESIKKKSDVNVKNKKITPKQVVVSTSGGIKKKSDENVENEKITTKKEDKKHVTEVQNTEKLTSANKIQKYAQNTAKPVTEIAKTHGNPRSNEKVVENKGTSKVVKKIVPKKLRNDNITKNNVEGKTYNEGATVNDASKIKVANDKNATTKNDVAGTTVGKSTKKIVLTKQTNKKLASDENVQEVVKVSPAPNTKVNEKVKVAKTIPGKTIVARVNKNAYVASTTKNPNNSIHTKIPVALHKPKATISSKNVITGITKALKHGNPGKENAQNNLKVSKINFKLSSENASKLPFRVSPRGKLTKRPL